MTIAAPMPIFGLIGWSGSGKTTLVIKLLPELTGRGLEVSTIKHAHHTFDTDIPGKDSYEHRKAGAREVLISSRHRWALVHENADRAELDLEALVGMMEPVDLLLIEGFKRDPHAKLEVHRPSLGKPLIASEDPHVVAIASDEKVDHLGLDLPLLDLNDVASIAAFIVDYCGLAGRCRKRA